jgi:signal transduction histidine kinase
MRHRLRETQRRLVETEQLATVGRLASTISHDLRRPLTAVLAYAEFLSERELTDAQRKDYYDEIRVAVNRMMDDVNSLLGFSKESDALRLVDADVQDTIERAIASLTSLPEFESTTFHFSRGPGVVARFDPAKLERVMLNLLSNAAEAVPAGAGRVVVTCESTALGIEIRVADNGPGIPAAIAGSVFQPFVSHGKDKGIGLGLTIVQTIMRQHGGEAVVERSNESGAVFLLRLPQGGEPVL